MKLSTTQAKTRERFIALVRSFPEADVVEKGTHLSLEVRGKRFGYYLEDHHGDGRIALNCKAGKMEAQGWVLTDPERFHIPKYVGRLGWIGYWLDRPRPAWTEVKLLLTNAYRLTAPVALVKDLRL